MNSNGTANKGLYISLVVTDGAKSIYASQHYMDYKMAYHYFFNMEMPLPTFDIGEMEGFKYVKDDHKLILFVDSRIAAKALGRLEYMIYQLTGLRGDTLKFQQLEFLGTPNASLKKFIMKRT